MKKKITLVATSVLLVAAMVIGGTLAYFTDTDKATNTFTVGGVEIDLIEKTTDADGNWVEWDPEDAHQLMPGENNAVFKNVTVKNTAATPAYMWIELWIPTALDAGENDAANNSLHWNYFDTYNNNGTLEPMRGSVAQSMGLGDPVYVTDCKYLGVKDGYTGYRIWIVDDEPKNEGESTAALLHRVFMDQRVAQCNDKTHADNCLVLTDGTTHYTGEWEIIVNAFGIQAEGFANIEEAIAAYDGEGAGQP